MRRPARPRKHVTWHFAHDLDSLQRLRRTLGEVAPRHTEEAIADRTLQHTSYHAFGFIAREKPNMTRTQDFADQGVERSDHAGRVERIGVSEVETHPCWLGRRRQGHLEGAQAFEPGPDFTLQSGELSLRLLQRFVDLQHPPVGIRIVGAGALSDGSNKIGKADKSDDGRLVSAVAAALHEPLRLTGLQREHRAAAENPWTLIEMCARRGGRRRYWMGGR